MIALPAQQETLDDVSVMFGTAHIPDRERIGVFRRDGVFERRPHLFVEPAKGCTVPGSERFEPGFRAGDEGKGHPAGA